MEKDQPLLNLVANELLFALVFIKLARESLAKGICFEGETALEKAAKHTSRAIELLPELAKLIGSPPA